MYSWYPKIKEYTINERKYKSFCDDITNEKKFEKIIKQNKKTKKNRNKRRKKKMTNYIIEQELLSESGNRIIISLKSYFDLPNAKKEYDKIKNVKKNIPLVFTNQKLTTKLIMLQLGNTNLVVDKDYAKKEILEESEVNWKK